MGGGREYRTRNNLSSKECALFRVTRAQSSMEYLLVAGFSFLFLIAIIVVAYSQSSNFSHQVSASQVQRVGTTIVDSVNTVYVAGPPSKKTIRVFFPDSVQSVVISNTSLVFTLNGEGGAYEYALTTAGNMSGVIRPFSGMHTITFVASANVVNITDG